MRQPTPYPSAVFAARTMVVLAKAGVKGVSSDLTTAARTVVACGIIFVENNLADIFTPPRAWLFLGLPGLATGAGVAVLLSRSVTGQGVAGSPGR